MNYVKFIAILILLFSIIMCSDLEEKHSFQTIIKNQLKKYPEMQVQDLYKLAFQAAMGSAHFALDSVKAYNYLEYELQKVNADSTETLIEEIAPQGKVVRINLRPFKALSGDKEKLSNAFMQTAHKFKSSTKNLETYCQALIDLAEKKQIQFTVDELDSFFADMRKKSFPAVHHSEKYREKYNPAYRVIAKEFVYLLDIQYNR